MDIIIVMLAISLVLSVGFLCAFLWATKNNQFEDLVTPSWRAIFEDKSVSKKEEDVDAATEV